MGDIVDLEKRRGQAGRQPQRLLLQPVPSRSRAVLEAIWSEHQVDPSPYLSRRGFDEILRFADPPAQLLAITAEYDGPTEPHLAGHYAIDDRDTQIEFCFDRSFLGGMGLQRIAIDYRLYSSALSLVTSGRQDEFVPLYAAIDAANATSRSNFRAQGAIEHNTVPAYLRRDGGAEPVEIPGLVLSIFPPQAICAGFSRMLATLSRGTVRIGGRDVALAVEAGDIARPEVARRLAEDVRRLCEAQTLLKRE